MTGLVTNCLTDRITGVVETWLMCRRLLKMSTQNFPFWYSCWSWKKPWRQLTAFQKFGERLQFVGQSMELTWCNCSDSYFCKSKQFSVVLLAMFGEIQLCFKLFLSWLDSSNESRKGNKSQLANLGNFLDEKLNIKTRLVITPTFSGGNR